MFYKQHNSTAYQLTDHLGNVRAVVSKEGKIDSSTDYYPFGMPMPNRIKGANSYRYAFQGQEKDEKTGKESFQLRLWDSRIGRWLTTDPMGEFHSPYLGMGNNPISSIDPSGGCVGCDPNAAIGSTDFDSGGFGVTMTESGWARNDGYEVNIGSLHNVQTDYLKWTFKASFFVNSFETVGGFLDKQNEASNRLSKSMQVVNLGVTTAFHASGSLFYGLNINKTSSFGAGRVFNVNPSSTRVGQWMTKGEYESFAQTGVIPRGNVLVKGADGFKDTNLNYYVKFNVHPSILKTKDVARGWEQVIPNSQIQQRLAASKGITLPKPIGTEIRLDFVRTLNR